MTQQPERQQPIIQGATKVNLRELAPGDRVKMGDDIIVEVTENPRDGMWIRGKYITVPAAPAMEGTEDQIFAADVTDKA
jgi:hypothetical protein